MDKIVIVYILSIIAAYIKLVSEKKIGRIGTMSIIISTFYYAIFSLIIVVLNYLKLYDIFNFVIKLDIVIIAVCMLIYSLFSIIVSKKSKYLRKYVSLDIINIILNVIFIILV